VPHHLAPAHHRNGVGHLHDLAQLVGDQQDRHAVAFQRPQNVEQPVGLVRRQHARRLVQDQDPRPAPQRFQYLDALLQPDAQIADQRVRVDLQPVLAAQAFQFGPGRGDAVLQQRPALGAQHHILQHGEGGHQHEVLMHHADPQPDRIRRIVDPHRFAVDLDPPAIRGVEAVENAHQRRLARPVLADNAVDRARPNFKRYIIIRLYRPEILANFS
jgi:hypothetical protein